MANLAVDYVDLTRICEFARRLHQLHRLGDDNSIDREFSAVCRAIWGFTLDDFTDEDLSPRDHAWLDQLSPRNARSISPPTRDTTSRTTSTGAVSPTSPTGGASRG